MNRYRLLFPFFFFITLVHAQKAPAPPGKEIEKVINDLKKFREGEIKRDSVAAHPLGSHKEKDFIRQNEFYRKTWSKLQSINKVKLNNDDQVNHELLQYDIEDHLSVFRFKSYLNPILADEGFHTGLAHMASEILSTKKEYDHYIKRLRDIPRFVDEHLTLMNKGLSLGICQPRSILNGYENTYEQHIVTDYSKSIFWKPFLQKPVGISDTDWEKIRAEAIEAIEKYAIAGFKSIRNFFEKEYFIRTRNSIGVSNFPDGLAFYQDRVNHFTSTSLSYESIYQTGLNEVERIKKEMFEIINELKFTGSLQDFITSLRTDSQFYATTPAQLLKEAAYIAKKADGKLPAFFNLLPRQPYGVEEVPAHLAPTYTAGRYSGAPVKSKKAGYYWVNTYDLKSRPLYALEALTLHEAMPGHHLQIALAKEMTGLPEFRKSIYVNAFGEGWGLYCEYLGTEMGFYKDPYSRFGKLTYEMWRACRLVLDVALHTKGWTRQQAINYLSENTALSLHEVNTEINRYISWPGQALAYKIGELKIRELRKKAEVKLKDKFEIREFHGVLLSQGSVTLDILERLVDNYIAEKLN